MILVYSLALIKTKRILNERTKRDGCGGHKDATTLREWMLRSPKAILYTAETYGAYGCILGICGEFFGNGNGMSSEGWQVGKEMDENRHDGVEIFEIHSATAM